MLTSTKNPRIKQIRKLQNNSRARSKAGLFVTEGIRLVEEVLHSGWLPKILLYTEDIGSRGLEMVAEFQKSDVEVLLVASHVMQAASDTQTPQGILAVLPIPNVAPLPVSPNFLLILDGIRDPGNMGTILRTARAAGVDAVLLPEGVVDPFSPKVVRSAMGAHFNLPICAMRSEEIAEFVAAGISLFLADSTGGQSIFETDFTSPLALIISSEAHGASTWAKRLATQRVHIPMPGGAESLNAAVAGAILTFEVVRQRQ